MEPKASSTDTQRIATDPRQEPKKKPPEPATVVRLGGQVPLETR